MKPILYCDVDGVVRNLIYGICCIAGAEYDDKIHRSINEWDCKLFDKDITEWIKDDNVFLTSRPYDGSLDFIRKLSKICDIIFLTCQHNSASKVTTTVNWLYMFKFMKFAKGISFVFEYEQKIQMINNCNNIFLIDDNPLLTTKYNTLPNFISFKRPWNNNGLFDNYDDIIEFVKQKINGGGE